MAELPDFTLRVSTRARRAHLKISAHDGLVVVIPRRFSQRRIPELLRQKRDWIQRTLQKVEVERQQILAAPHELPGAFSLAAIGEEWTVEFQRTVGTRYRIAETTRGLFAKQLLLTGPDENIPICLTLLRRWLKRRAEAHLIPRLQAASSKINFSCTSVRISSARTHWGSCSRSQRISLNRNLLFLPFELAEHVLLHELCHTVQHDHSDKFWALMARFDPDWKAHRRALRSAGKFVPGWAAIKS